MVEKLNFLNALMEQSHNRAPVKLSSNALNDVLYYDNTPFANKPSTAMWAGFRILTYPRPANYSEKENKHQANPTIRLPASVSKHCIIQFFETMVSNSTVAVFSPAKNKTVLI